jgi:type II secretory pathway pseudopilin PulG
MTMTSPTGQTNNKPMFIRGYNRAVVYRAFTLLELILVMIILCTVLGMVAPSLQGFFSSRQIKDIGEQMVALAQYAKTQSVYRSQYYRMNFDLDKRQYWLSVLEKSEYQRLENDFGSKFIIPSDIDVKFENFSREGPLFYVEFNPEGYSKQCKIMLEDDKRNYIDVVCYGPTENFEMVERTYGEKDQRQ